MSGNTRLAELRKNFQKSNANVPTPENQFGAMKKNKEKSAKAVRIAKARAARYNMTIRALAITTNTEVSKMQRKDVIDKKKMAKEHSNYKATSRGINVSRGVTARERRNIAKALTEDVSPTIAKNVIRQVAKKNIAETRKSVKAAMEDDEDIKTDDEEDEEAKKNAVPGKNVEIDGVYEALSSQDPNALNRAILTNFLSSHAPHLQSKTDELLGQFSDKMGLLFSGLLNKYPNENDATISGKQKADKEIAEAILSGDKKIPQNVGEVVPNDDASDDSFVMDEAKIDKFEGKDDNKTAVVTEPVKVKAEIKVEDFTLGLDDDDDDSMVATQDKNFQKAYNKTLKRGEKSPIHALKSLARRRTTVKLNNDLSEQVKHYEKEERKSFKTLAEDDDDDSLVETNAQYITNIEQVKEETEEEPVRWAVQFQNKNLALKQKLMKQGLNEEQVAELVDNLDNNTSEML